MSTGIYIIEIIIIIMKVLEIIDLSRGIYKLRKAEKEIGCIAVAKVSVWQYAAIITIVYYITVITMLNQMSIYAFIGFMAIPTFLNYNKRIMLVTNEAMYTIGNKYLFKDISTIYEFDNRRLSVVLNDVTSKKQTVKKLIINDKERLMRKYNSYLDNVILEKIK